MTRWSCATAVLTGDIVSLSGMVMVVRVAGSEQRFDRNHVKRLLFVQRQAVEPSN